MFARSPNGFLVHDLIIFNHLSRGGYAAKGFRLEFPDLRQAPPAVLNEVQDQWRLILRTFPEHYRLQLLYYSDSDYEADFERFDKDTARTDNAWVKRIRDERTRRYRDRMRRGELRRQRLVVFVSRPLIETPPLLGSREALTGGYTTVLQQLAEEFARFGKTLKDALSQCGVRVTPMCDRDHYQLYAHLLTPSLVDRPGFDPLTTFDPNRSIQENCWLSEAAGREGEFWMDGFHHAMLVVTRWCHTTYPGIVAPFSLFPNLQVTVNMEPLPVREEIRREENLYARVEGQHKSEGKPSLLTVLDKKRGKIQALTGGFLRPFRVHYLLRVWARTGQALAAQLAALRQAVNSLNGAQAFQPGLPSSVKRFFFATWPGWLWEPYPHRKLYAEDSYLADLILFCTSFCGYLDEAEVLLDGPQDSVVGIKTISSRGAGGAPAHGLLVGGSGVGKSVLVGELLTQLAAHYGLLVLVDYGLSYEALVPLLDPAARAMILRRNGNLTLNYLDSQGLPVTPDLIADAATLLCLMAGRSPSESEQRTQRTRFERYIKLLYRDAFEAWSRRHPQQALDVARLACLLERRPKSAESTLLEAYVDFRDWQARAPDEAQAALHAIRDGEATRAFKHSVTRDTVRHLAFTRFAPEEYPTHQQLQELMLLDAAAADRQSARDLAELLAAWRRDGSHGPLFDGASRNLCLDGRVVCFELGQLPDSDEELRAAATFLVRQYVWRHIYTRPRALRKLMVFEEAAAWLRIPGAAEILTQGYQQARKYNTWLLSVLQNYAELHTRGLSAAVAGNSQQFFLLKQNHPDDLNLLGKDLGLSPSAMDAIQHYPKPEQAGHAAFTYFHRDTPQPVCGTVLHRPAPEMLYVAGTDGPHVEQRRRELQDGITLERVAALANSKPTA